MMISGRTPPAAVEYDCKGERKIKVFKNAYEAKRFYVAKDKAGKNPKSLSVTAEMILNYLKGE